MNNKLKAIKITECLFVDIECVRRSKDLDLDSKEFQLFAKKNRNKTTGEFPPNAEILDLYQKEAALRMCYNKIVCIGVGYVVKGELRVKSIYGEEAEIIKQFCDISRQFEYLVTFNGINFDLPTIVSCSARHFDIAAKLKDDFNPSGKKEWDMKKVIDLMQHTRGTFYNNPSFDEVCYLYNVVSPKDGEIEGSKVSEEYWTNGIKLINEYVVKDIIALVQLFYKMRWENFDVVIVNKTDSSTVEQVHPEKSLLQKIYEDRGISEENKDEILKLTSKKKLTKKDKENLFTILRGVLVREDFENQDQDTKATIQQKEEDVKAVIEGLNK